MQPLQSSKHVESSASASSVKDPVTAATSLLENLIDGDLETAPLRDRLESVSAAIDVVVQVAKDDIRREYVSVENSRLLTMKTRDVFQLLRKGWSVEQISLHLVISTHAVRYHIRKINKAYNTNSYEEAIRIAEENERSK